MFSNRNRGLNISSSQRSIIKTHEGRHRTRKSGIFTRHWNLSVVVFALALRLLSFLFRLSSTDFMRTLINLPEQFRSLIEGDVLMLSKKVDVWKMLHLPDVSWLELLGAAACLVVVIWAILRFVSRVNEDVDPAEADREMLQALMDLRREGQVSEDEFRSIKGQIVGRLNNKWTDAPKEKKPAGTAGLEEALQQVLLTSAKSDSDKEEPTSSESASAESIQTETSPSSKNLPEPPQDNDTLAERSEPSESEKGEGLTG